MKQLILIRGLSGSGKTALAETICGDLEDRFMVSSDDFFVDDSGEYSFNPASLKEAHLWCQKECKEALEDGYDVIVVHNTFSRKWECDPYMRLAHQNGYRLQVINLYDGGLSDRELSDRCVHNIPPHLIQKQRKRWDKDVYRERRPQNHYNPHYRHDNRGGYGYNNRGGYDNRGDYYKRGSRW